MRTTHKPDEIVYHTIPSIKCPQCGRISYHPEDIKQRYCGACHMWHNNMRTKTMNITVPNTNPIYQLYCEVMACVSLFRYLREQKDRKINIEITTKA